MKLMGKDFQKVDTIYAAADKLTQAGIRPSFNMIFGFPGEGGPERTNRRFHYLAYGNEATRLSTAFDSTTLYGEDLKTVGEFTVEAGESVPFVLSHGTSFQEPPPPVDPFNALERTAIGY